MINGNGLVTYEVGVGSTYVVKTVRGKITPRRVEISTRIWDREGRRVSAYRSGMMSMRLLSYGIDGEEVTFLAEPSA